MVFFNNSSLLRKLYKFYKKVGKVVIGLYLKFIIVNIYLSLSVRVREDGLEVSNNILSIKVGIT